MPKQYNLYQGENVNTPNNYCAGYALDAILYNKGLINGQTPLNTYENIQNIQNRIVNDLDSLNILNDTVQGGTKFSFPSAIVEYYRNAFNRRLMVNMDCNILSQFYGDSIINVEKTRMGGIGVMVENSSMDTILNDQTHSHHMLLINNGTHWISVVNEKGELYMYDPGTPNFSPVTIDMLRNIYSGIIITLD